jgi:2-phospho-L-lactate guanylyltransferase
MSHMAAAPVTGWTVVVPVKALDRGKTRLSRRPAGERRGLSLAFALDTVAAALACPAVGTVVVVGDDDVRDAVVALGAQWMSDPGTDLNAALRHVEAALGEDAAVAALVGDLPALHPDELGAALALAAEVGRGLVADASGIGTTLLTAAPGHPLEPRFGGRSRAAHKVAGAVELPIGRGSCPGLRRDVDTEVDLWDAERLGVGAATRAALSAPGGAG